MIKTNKKMTDNFEKKVGFAREISQNKVLYLMTLPGLLLVLVFAYIPMLGITIAFKDGKRCRAFLEANG